jgi:hypothetical protein
VVRADEPALFAAVRAGDKAKVEQLLAQGADINAKTKDGWTAIQVAAATGNKEMVELLIAKGADLITDNETSYQAAIRAGHPEIAEILGEATAKAYTDYDERHPSPGVILARRLDAQDAAEKKAIKEQERARTAAADAAAAQLLEIVTTQGRDEVAEILNAKGTEVNAQKEEKSGVPSSPTPLVATQNQLESDSGSAELRVDTEKVTWGAMLVVSKGMWQQLGLASGEKVQTDFFGRTAGVDVKQVVAGLVQNAAQLSAAGLYILGTAYDFGIVVPADQGLAAQCYQESAKQDVTADFPERNRNACYFFLGLHYFSGIGVPQNYEQAVRWFRKAAETSDQDPWVSACLGICYYYGLGVPQDKAEALKWFQKAPDKDPSGSVDPWNQLWAGLCHKSAGGGVQEQAQAASCFREASLSAGWYDCWSLLKGLDNVFGPGKVGILEGDSPEGNALRQLPLLSPDQQVEAAKNEAAIRGQAIAVAELGLCYYYGRGVPQDYTKAAKLFRMAAEKGLPGAMHNLSVCYEHGEGVPQDASEAAKWSSKAQALRAVQLAGHTARHAAAAVGQDSNAAEEQAKARADAEQQAIARRRAEEQATAHPMVSTTVDKFCAEFEGNRFRAEQRYKNAVVEVAGSVSTIDEKKLTQEERLMLYGAIGATDEQVIAAETLPELTNSMLGAVLPKTYIVTLDTGPSEFSFVCLFSEDRKDDVLRLTKGQTVTIVGIMRGVLSDEAVKVIEVINCRLKQ